MGIDWRRVTAFFVASIIAIILVYDVFVFIKAGTEGTISRVLIDWSYQLPIFPFTVGVIIGHLFWRIKDDTFTSRWGK